MSNYLFWTCSMCHGSDLQIVKTIKAYFDLIDPLEPESSWPECDDKIHEDEPDPDDIGEVWCAECENIVEPIVAFAEGN